MDKNLRWRILFPAVLLFVLSIPALEAVPNLRIERVPRKITDNKTATAKVLLEWPQAEGPYEINATEPALENLSMVRQSQSLETGALVCHTIIYEFRPLGAGKARVLPFEVSYRSSDAAPWVPLLVPEQDLDVVSSVPGKIIWISVWIAAGIAFSVVAGLLIAKTLQRREVAKKIVPPDPKQRIYAKAQEAIATFSSTDPKERLGYFASQLRTVAGAYYDLPSEAMTEPAFLALLKKKGLPAAEWAEVSGLFEQLEQMRFSRKDLTPYELERTQKTLLQYIQGKIIMGKPD